MDKLTKMEKLACHLCQIIGGGVCDIDSKDCGILPEMSTELEKGLLEISKEFCCAKKEVK